MTLTPQRFTRKPETVEAVQVTEDNMAEVAEWCGGELSTELRTGLPAILIEDGGVALLGEWVTRDEHGYFEAESAGFEHGWAPALPSTAQVTEYRLSLFPDGDPMGRPFSIWVRRAVAPDLWAVWGYCGDSLDTAGNWVWRSRADADWWPFEEAMRRAEEALPRVEVMGKTARDVLAERGEAGT